MEIGKKIKDFGIGKFGTVTKFAEALGMKPQNLYDYFNKGIMPGAEFLMQLKKMGCDMNWLLSEEDKSALEVREPSLNYKIETLEKKLIDMEEENELLRKTIVSASDLLNIKKLKKKK